MHTVMTHNGGYDSILLVDESDRVLSAWTASIHEIRDYVDFGEAADNWEVDAWPAGFHPDDGDEELRTINAYGTEVGRDGVMSEERREFWRV